MSVTKKVWALILVLLSTSLCLAEPYSEMWISNGDTFNLDEEIYSVKVANSPIQVLVQNGKDFSEIFSIGECFETFYQEVCFSAVQTMDNNGQQVKIELTDLTPVVSIEVSTDNQSYFAGEEQEITFIINVNTENPPEEIYFETRLHENLIVDAKNSFQIKDLGSGTKYSQLKIGPKGNESYEYTFKINSNYAKIYSVGAEVAVKYHEYFKSEFAKPAIIEYKPHYELEKQFPEFNQSEDYHFELVLLNVVDEDLKNLKIEAFVPKDLELISSGVLTEQIISDIGGESYTPFLNELEISIGENETFKFISTHTISNNFSIPLVLEYDYDGEIYFSEEQINFSVTVNDSIDKLWCTGENDLNVSLKYVQASYLDKLNGTDNVEDYDFYPGMDTDMRVYMISNVNEHMSDVKISLYKENELKLQEYYEVLRGGQRVLVGRFNETIGFGNYSFDVEIEYFCDETEEQYIQNGTEEITVMDIDRLTLNKQMEEEVLEGEEIEVSLNVENAATKYVHNINVFETIPEGFSTKGTTNKTFSLKNEESAEAYTYFLTAPRVEEDTSYIIRTDLYFEFEGVVFNYSDETAVIVRHKNETKITFELTPQANVRKYEPLALNFKITNEDDIRVDKLQIIIPESVEYDVENIDATIPAMYPEQVEEITINIIPKVDNLTIEEIELRYSSEKDNTPKIVNVDEKIRGAKIKFPEIKYELEVVKELAGHYTNTFTFNNPSDLKFNGAFTFDETKKEIMVGAKKTITEIIITQKSNFSEKNNHNNTEEYLNSHLEYEYINKQYRILLSGVRYHEVIPPPVIIFENESQQGSNQTNSTTESVILDESNMTGKGLTIILILGLGLIGAGIMTGAYLFKHKSKDREKQAQESKTISQEDISKAETGVIQESHIVDEKAKGEIILQENKEPEEKIQEKEIQDIKPSNIFSFSDYEKLKEDWDNKLKDKHKK